MTLATQMTLWKIRTNIWQQWMSNHTANPQVAWGTWFWHELLCAVQLCMPLHNVRLLQTIMWCFSNNKSWKRQIYQRSLVMCEFLEDKNKELTSMAKQSHCQSRGSTRGFCFAFHDYGKMGKGFFKEAWWFVQLCQACVHFATFYQFARRSKHVNNDHWQRAKSRWITTNCMPLIKSC